MLDLNVVRVTESEYRALDAYSPDTAYIVREDGTPDNVAVIVAEL